MARAWGRGRPQPRRAKRAIVHKHHTCERIIHVAQARGYTIEELARRAKMPMTTVWNIISGAVRFPRIDSIEKLAIALDLADLTVIPPMKYVGNVRKFRR